MVCRAEQPPKVPSGRAVIPLPMVTEVRATHDPNTLVPRVFTVLGIVTDLRPEPLKVEPGSVVSPLPMLTEVILEQP